MTLHYIFHCTYFLIIIHQTKAALPEDGFGTEKRMKSLWFDYINSTINILEEAIENNETSQVCNKHLKEVIDGGRSGEEWANKMIDSIGRPNSGILEVSLSFLGFYSECIETNGPNFSGKYCLATVRLPKSALAVLGKLSDLPEIVFAKTPIKVGTCFPSTCSLKDINIIVNRISSHLIHNCDVTISKCYQHNDQSLRKHFGSVIVIGIFGCLLLLVIVGTVCDHMQLETYSQMELLCQNNVESNPSKQYDYLKRDSRPIFYQLLVAFSLKTNANKILDTKRNDNSVQVFHGIRFLSMVWIIGGHSFAFAALWMNFRNPLKIREAPQNFVSQILANGTFSVDCFFFISGFLVSYVVLKEMKNNGGKLNWKAFYAHRYLRMTPSMMAVIALSATLLQYMGEGPQWMDSITMFNSWCQKNWWLNSLYLHNFINTNNMCLSHSWYSAVDMQLYLISPIILVPLYLKPVVGLAIASGFMILSISTTIALTITNHFPAVPYFNDLIAQEVLDKYYGSIYIKPYCRIGPYLVGIILAYAIYTSQGDIKMKKIVLNNGMDYSLNG